MARYPTFEEYHKNGNYADGLKKTDDFLRKNADDIQLLTLKLYFQAALQIDQSPVLEQLLSRQPPVKDFEEFIEIEEAVILAQKYEWPQPTSAGLLVAKLWDQPYKAAQSLNDKLNIQTLRFGRGIENNRLADVQQALIQLKVLQPKNRVFYFAHAAITQLLSTSNEDLQARLAIGLARKAVKEGFDTEVGLDCRVPGQIFAIQGAKADLEGIVGTRFGESKHVYDAVKRSRKEKSNGIPNEDGSEKKSRGSEIQPLQAEVEEEKVQFKTLIDSNAKEEDMVDFATKAVRLFTKACKEISDDRRRVKVDACFLAISGLVRLFEQTSGICYLLASAYLSETLLRHDEHIHEARMILVYLYMRLNLGSLAMRMFESLAVKEIQHDTVGHAVFTRLSLIHPFSTTASRKDSVEPFMKALKALDVYTRCEEKLMETEAQVLGSGQTGMIFDLQDLRVRLRTSLPRRIIHLEQRRLDRILNSGQGEDLAEIGPPVVDNWTTTTDSRDFAATFDYGYKVEKVLYGDGGVVPGTGWIVHTLAMDVAWCLACERQPPVKDVDKLLAMLRPSGPDLSQLKIGAISESGDGLLAAERMAGVLIYEVIRMLIAARVDGGDLQSNIDSVREAVARLEIGELFSREEPLATPLIDCYVYLDVLRITSKACRFVEQRSPGCAHLIRLVEEAAAEEFNELQRLEKEQDIKVGIRPDGVRSLVAKAEKISEALADLGSDPLDFFCESVAASARQGWEGIGKIRLA